MKKAYAHAKRVMMGVWSYLRQFMYTKWVIVVDDDINTGLEDVMATSAHGPGHDITVIEGTPIDYLSFASPKKRPRRQIGLDTATNCPETRRDWGQKIRMSDEIVELVNMLRGVGQVGRNLPGSGRNRFGSFT